MNYKIYFLRTARNDAINAVIGTVNTTPKLPDSPCSYFTVRSK
ncbi:hypothetical protein [Anaerostipes hadrus]|nr:hypothetical protein [Anaerostipes hadrus]